MKHRKGNSHCGINQILRTLPCTWVVVSIHSNAPLCVMCMSGVDYVSEDVTVTIGPTGSGSPDTVVCIKIDTATDTDIEGDESLTVIGTVTNNADLADFPDGNTVSITIQDASGEWWIGQRFTLAVGLFVGV